jgi:hypothetical protein
MFPFMFSGGYDMTHREKKQERERVFKHVLLLLLYLNK